MSPRLLSGFLTCISALINCWRTRERNWHHTKVAWAPQWWLRWRIMQTEWLQPHGNAVCIVIHEFTMQGLYPVCDCVCACVIFILLFRSVIHTHFSSFMSYFHQIISCFCPGVSPSLLLISLICTSHTLITINVLDRFTPSCVHVCEHVSLSLSICLYLALFCLYFT